jgi:recombinational DNA repair protein RecR
MYYVLTDEIDVKSKTNIPHEIIKKFMELLKHHQYEEIIIATN